MSIVTQGFISDTIITRGYAGVITEVVRDIARLISSIIQSVTIKSPSIQEATVTSKLDLEEDSV